MTTSIAVGCVIAGQERFTGHWIERENPTYPTRQVGRAAEGSESDAEGAIAAASDAFVGWAATPFEARAAALRAGADAVDALIEDIASLLCAELGKVIADCRGEIGFAAAYLRYALDATARVLGEDRTTDDGLGRLEVAAAPHGVIAAVTPWNAPVILSMLKVGPALATGNTVIVKPSPLAPLAVTQVLAAIAAQLPPGVLNVVHGHADVGRVLTGHPLVAKVAFTGGLATGQAIMRNAAETVKPLVLELGGNDAAVFLADADLTDDAIERAVHASFITSGQVCMAAKRLYVHRSRAEEFTARYLEIARDALQVGDPMDPAVTVGPLVTAQQRDHVVGLVEAARNAGATIHELGSIVDQDVVAGGYFARPTLVTGVADDDRLVRDEQFGPTVPLLTFDDEDEVVRRVNDSELGLGASVWSSDEDHAFALARRLETGFAFVNTHNRSGMAMRAAFGGVKQSGFGKEYGEAGVREYLRFQSINAPAAFRPGVEPAASGAGYPAAEAPEDREIVR